MATLAAGTDMHGRTIARGDSIMISDTLLHLYSGDSRPAYIGKVITAEFTEPYILKTEHGFRLKGGWLITYWREDDGDFRTMVGESRWDEFADGGHVYVNH